MIRFTDTIAASQKISSTVAATRRVRDIHSSELPTPSGAASFLNVLGPPVGAGIGYIDNVVTCTQAAGLLTEHLTVPANAFASGKSTYASSNTAILTVNAATGVVTPVAPGNVSVTVTTPGIGVQRFPVTVTRQLAVVSAWADAAGSLQASLRSFATARFAGLAPPSGGIGPGNLVSADGKDHVSIRLAGVKNPNLCYGAIDTSCIMVNQPGYAAMSGIALTRRHVLQAAHTVNVTPWPGHPYPTTDKTLAPFDPIFPTFIDSANNVFKRRFCGTSYISGDLAITRLDSELPDSIIPAKVMPANFRSYMPSLADADPGPIGSLLRTYGEYICLGMNQDDALVPHAFFVCPQNAGAAYTQHRAFTVQPWTSSLSNWWYSIRFADSGKPLVAIIGGDMVAIGTWYAFASGIDQTGPTPADFITEINNQIAVWGDTDDYGDLYQVQTADLSAFNFYGAT